jgi:hypothetical protein
MSPPVRHRITELTIATSLGHGLHSAQKADPACGGSLQFVQSDYRVGDMLAVHIGDGIAKNDVPNPDSVFMVTEVVSGIGVSKVLLMREGCYTKPPTNPARTTGGSGNGCTLEIDYTTPAIPRGLTSPTMKASGQNVRWRNDDTDPTPLTGNLLCAGEEVTVPCNPRHIRVIGAAPGASLSVCFEWGEGQRPIAD